NWKLKRKNRETTDSSFLMVRFPYSLGHRSEANQDPAHKMNGSLRYGDAAFRLSRKIHACENFTDIEESQTSVVQGFDCSPHPITIRIIDAMANISSRQLELDSKFSLNGPYEQAADSRISRSPVAYNRRAGRR